MSGASHWEFHCTTDGPDSLRWLAALDGALETLTVNALLDASLAQGSAAAKGLVILSAQYGSAEDKKHRVDVTSLCQDLVRQQGGTALDLPSR